MEKILIYQVLPRLFGNTKKKQVFNGSIEENGCGKLNDFTKERLKQIKELGATHIWYTGVIEHATQTDYSSYGIKKDHPAIVKGKAGSPYAIKDYYDIDPDLACDVKKRMKEFEALINRTHKEGLKAIIDFVPNHVAREYYSDAKPKNVKDLGEDDVKEVFFFNQNNFYYLVNESLEGRFDMQGGAEKPYSETPCKATGNNYFANNPGIYEWYETVKLNYGIDYRNNQYHDFSPIPNTWLKMRDILLFWCSKNVDGFRCDMAEMVPVAFWAWVIPIIKESYPNIIFIAETYDPYQYRQYIFDGKFDYLYDKVGLYDKLREIMRNEGACHDITGIWQQLDGIEEHILNFLENHDEQRIASPFFAGKAEKGIPAMIISSTLNTGAVMIYNGQEFGEEAKGEKGFSGDDGKTTIFDYAAIPTVQRWLSGELKKGEISLQQFYTKLLNICKNEKAIRKGNFFDLQYVNFNNPFFNTIKQYAYLRKKENELILIISNFEDFDVSLQINLPIHAFELLGIENNQERKYTDLLTNKSGKQLFSSVSPFSIKVKKNNGVILKFLL
ncbi:MAG: alpha-amylase [Bacteroidales bacterium]|nr:alpha-amylase [Bacteroidales bacterium]